MDTSSNSSNFSVHTFVCRFSREGAFIFSAWLIVYILFLPIFISVLYIGQQRWRKQCSVSMTIVSSHSDVITFHIVVVEILNIVGSCVFCHGMFTRTLWYVLVGGTIFNTTLNGQILFHVLTCVERYLAVVHPVTYRNLKQRGGVRIRNVSIGCVWMLSIILAIQSSVGTKDVIIIFISSWWALPSAVIPFCCFSVLYVLIRPRPGEVGRDIKQINQSKRRVLLTMTAIMGSLLMKIIIFFGSIPLFESPIMGLCIFAMCSLWGHLPSSLVLPLLFLHRAGKLPGCKQINKTLHAKFAHHCTLPCKQKATSP